jgi:hypothetical protein
MPNPPIDTVTATNWINGNAELQIPAHPSCHLESGWNFQWAPEGTANPGDNNMSAGSPWTTSGATAVDGTISINVPVAANGHYVWVREVPKAGYIPFSGDTSSEGGWNDVSAEIYCNVDVLNYDNYDRVDNMVAGQTYHCVAWNVPTTPDVCPNLEGIQATVPQDMHLNNDGQCVPNYGGSTPTVSNHLTVVTGNTSAGENLLGWMFNRDLSTATDYEFNTAAASIGTGSLFVLPIVNTPNSDKFVGELFLQTPISGVNSIKYDFKIGTNADTDKDQFYMNVYANFGVSSPTKFYDCRYNVVPTAGSIAGFTTVTFDPTQSYPVTQHGSSPSPCPSSPAAMGAGATIRVVALNVGDTSGSDMGVSGYLDKVVTSITTGLNTHTETYDFEPTPIVTLTGCTENCGGGDDNDTPTEGSSRSGGSRRGSVAGASTGAPTVLGASTDLPDLPDTGNGERSQAFMVTLSLFVALLALNTVAVRRMRNS